MSCSRNYLMIGIVVSFLLSCSQDEKEMKQILRPVKYQQVGFQDADMNRTFSGTTQSDKTIKLSFRSTGIITKFNIKLGEKVKKGQLLAKIDNEQSRLTLEKAKSALASSESQMKTAKLNYDRTRALYQKGSTSLSNFESAKNQYETAEQAYNSAKRDVSLQKDQLSYGSVYATSDGIISAVYSEIGENVNPGQTIATLNSGDNMEIAFGLPESIINKVKLGMQVKVDFAALEGQEFSAEVTEVALALDQNTSTYPVSVTIQNSIEEIKSGMSANVTFEFASKEVEQDQLMIPAVAVGEDSKGNFVFLLEEYRDSIIAKKQPIEIGELTSNGFIVKSGITKGQKIAVAGLQTLLDGQQVKLNQ